MPDRIRWHRGADWCLWSLADIVAPSHQSMLALAFKTTPPGGGIKERDMRTLLRTVMLLLTPQGAMAGQNGVPLSKLIAQQVVLRDELAKFPKDLTPRQVGLIRKAQGESSRLVDGKSNVDQLAIEDKVRVENAP